MFPGLSIGGGILGGTGGRANPALMGIPQTLLDDPSDTARKKVMRMKRNYAFDRARYFLPVAPRPM
jgi:hypothetical protein